MISEKIQEALNAQIIAEAEASHLYTSMGSWSEIQGYKGFASFMHKHAQEENMHMLKLVKFINDRGGKAVIPSLRKPKPSFLSFKDMFQNLFNHEVMISKKINDLVELTLKEKDYPTFQFLLWYVEEQVEEETLARELLDKINVIGDDKGGLYLFDKDLGGE